MHAKLNRIGCSPGDSESLKVVMACSGLGHIVRGFETFTEECYAALRSMPGLDLHLCKGGGAAAAAEHVMFNFPRKGGVAKVTGGLMKRDPYWVEQITFGLALLPLLRRIRPEVVFFSDANLGNLLWRWRWWTGAGYKLLFSNGGPFSPPFPRWDHVQELTPSHLRTALAAGESPARISFVPYGISLPREYAPCSEAEQRALRRALDLPVERPVLLSVGAFNTHHKRVDYLINEVAATGEPRPFLLLLGEEGSETNMLKQLASERLGKEGAMFRTVPTHEISRYYQASDLFVLASLQEGFGRVLLEAMASGLQCVVHDCENFRFILEDHGIYGDLTRTGTLSRILSDFHSLVRREVAPRRASSIRRRFSWEVLGPQYVRLLERAAGRGTSEAHGVTHETGKDHYLSQ